MFSVRKSGLTKIVEFIGLPCSGKTSICELLTGEGGDPRPEAMGFCRMAGMNFIPGWRSDSKNFRHYLRLAIQGVIAAVWVLLRPRLTFAVIKHSLFASSQPKKVGLYRIIMLYYYLAAQTWLRLYTRLWDYQYDFILLDQGVIQAITSLDLNNPAIPEAVFDYIRLPDMLVVMNVNPDTALERISQRTTGESRLDSMGGEEARMILKNLHQAIEHCQRILSGKVVMCLDVGSLGQSIQEGAEKVVDCLERSMAVK